MILTSSIGMRMFFYLILLFVVLFTGCGDSDDGIGPPDTLMAGSYQNWAWDSSMSLADPLYEKLCEGRWNTIDASHKLVNVEYNVIFETDEDGNYRFWYYDNAVCLQGKNPFPREVGHGFEPTLRSSNPIVYMSVDNLLTFHDGNKYTVWHIDRRGGWADDLVIDKVVDTGDSHIYDTDTVLYLGDGNVLLWRPDSFAFAIFKYDFTSTGNQFGEDSVVINGTWTKFDPSHRLTYMGYSNDLDRYDIILDVDSYGNFRYWHYDRWMTGHGDPLDSIITSGRKSGITSTAECVNLDGKLLFFW